MARASKQPRQRYAKVARALWSDETFLAWGAPKEPTAQWLWIFLLTTPLAGSIPGIMQFSLAETAERFGWDVSATRVCLDEIVTSGRAEYDPVARLIYLPNGLRWNEPESPNVVLGWARQWSELPECALKSRAATAFRRHLGSLSPAYVSAFDACFSDRRGKPSGKAVPENNRPFPESKAGAVTGTEAGAVVPTTAPLPPKLTRETGPEVDTVVGVLTDESPLLGIAPQDVPAWSKGLVDSLDLPKAASPLPYVRTAIAKLRDVVAATPGTPGKDRLTYLRRTTVGLVNDDKIHGWASGKTDGREGVCAPAKAQRSSGSFRSNERVHPMQVDADHEVAEMRRTLAGGAR